LLTAVLIRVFSPNPPVTGGASPMRELSALHNRQVWMTLGTGAIGFGGLFCVYTYLASTLSTVTHAGSSAVPIVFAVFGIGSTLGTLVCGWAADKSTTLAAALTLAFSVVALVLFPAAAAHIVTLAILVFLIGGSVGLSTILQTRLMDVAGDAQALAGALMQSAFNVANTIGPWVGGLVISAGYGDAATGYAGAALALGGLLMWGLTVLDARPGRN